MFVLIACAERACCTICLQTATHCSGTDDPSRLHASDLAPCVLLPPGRRDERCDDCRVLNLSSCVASSLPPFPLLPLLHPCAVSQTSRFSDSLTCSVGQSNLLLPFLYEGITAGEPFSTTPLEQQNAGARRRERGTGSRQCWRLQVGSVR